MKMRAKVNRQDSPAFGVVYCHLPCADDPLRNHGSGNRVLQGADDGGYAANEKSAVGLDGGQRGAVSGTGGNYPVKSLYIHSIPVGLYRNFPDCGSGI